MMIDLLTFVNVYDKTFMKEYRKALRKLLKRKFRGKHSPEVVKAFFAEFDQMTDEEIYATSRNKGSKSRRNKNGV